MKKGLMILMLAVFLINFVAAQQYSLGIELVSEDKLYNPGEAIHLKVILRDSNNSLINENIDIRIENLKEDTILEKTILSNELNTNEIIIPENALSGEAKIFASYQDSEVEESFFVTEQSKIKFEIIGEKLIVTNVGNTKYQETIYIAIGETTGRKTPHLNVGESTNYLLVAPEGNYNIKVTDGTTTLERANVRLTGTGRIVGAIDEKATETGVTLLSPELDSEGSLIEKLKGNLFTYIFVIVIFGAVILLAIERNFRKKLKE